MGFKVGDKVIFRLDEITAIQSADGVIERPGIILKTPYTAGGFIRQIAYLIQEQRGVYRSWWVAEENIKLDYRYYRELKLTQIGI